MKQHGMTVNDLKIRKYHCRSQTKVIDVEKKKQGLVATAFQPTPTHPNKKQHNGRPKGMKNMQYGIDLVWQQVMPKILCKRAGNHCTQWQNQKTKTKQFFHSILLAVTLLVLFMIGRVCDLFISSCWQPTCQTLLAIKRPRCQLSTLFLVSDERTHCGQTTRAFCLHLKRNGHETHPA